METFIKNEDVQTKFQTQDDCVAPEKGCEVYVTRIPRNLQEKDLKEIFSRVGELLNLRLMMEPSGINRGYAYIRYKSVQDAKEAIKLFNNYEIFPNRYLVVTKSVDNRRLWVNGIPKNKSIEDIRREMEKLTAGVNDIILYPSQTDKTRSRGYMFVEYESHKAASLARRKLTQGSVCICGHELGQVDWAEPEHEVDEETMSNVKILFVRNLMLSTTEETLRILFNRKGNNEVERVKKTKDFAFVHFSTRSSAEKALSSCETLKIDGALVEVLWSKPVDKKLYNTRKTLTKVFTMGTEILDRESGTLQGLLPRKRGAAGISGLGAPGTAPSKQLVQRYCSLTASTSPQPSKTNIFQNNLNNFSYYRSAPDILLDVCLINRWGEPIYTLNTAQPTPDTTFKMYICKITIPSFPLPPPHNAFYGFQFKPTAEEARLEAAHFVLACLRISPDYMCSISSYSPAPVPQVYPVSAATLQGVPLTIATTGAAAYPSGSGAHYPSVGPATGYPATAAGGLRLVYPDPYMANYASMLTSMCTLNVSG